ncbi:prolyl oligopeptidase family serine peptidase [Jidongwangia harbinensis]|uniref:prolyl oligopeptidase family serine peptidase n=1 Tax=Jidongwangia harbinensis TaxID=2878561 RepID=UPI001CD9308A|nr:prolyl oligopeptidase family serine peptidase [Jidongwangia harbinensis]MCA2214055.1 prolyl oligopeptidase family serine peptidase [Jidongwangia harbinensis]
MLFDVDFPELVTRTGSFRHGAPHAVTVGADGARVAFLRSSGGHDPAARLWVLTVATGQERPVSPPGVAAYGTDRLAEVAAFVLDGRLHRVDLRSAEVRELDSAEPAIGPHPDPTGHHIGYVTPTDCLRVIGPDGTDELLAGEPGGGWRDPGGVRWGVPDPAAAEFGRTRGWWWSPDGRQILAERAAGSISLHLLDLDGGWVDVHWDRETYPYVVDVHWGDVGGPLITVLRRLQQHGLVLSVDPRTGETQVHAELADARWVEPVSGTPRHLPDGRVLVGGELAHDGFDARCLFADGSLLTPPGLYVRRVVGVLPRTSAPAAGPDLIVEGTDGDPAVQDVFRVRTSLGGGGAEARPVTTAPGWYTAEVGGDVLVIGDGREWTVWRGTGRVATLRSHAEPLPYAPKPSLERVTDRRLPTSVLYPQRHLIGRELPVLLTLGDGPGHQQVVLDRAGWQDRQWWADAGFAVVGVDGRGTPGVAPSFEKVVHRRLADIALADLIDALVALVGKHPDLDLRRIAVRGSGLGGWLAALTVLRRAEFFRCAVARDPIVDWGRLPAPFAERYLGRAADSAEVYAHHSLLDQPGDANLMVVGPQDVPGAVRVEAATWLEERDFLHAHLA